MVCEIIHCIINISVYGSSLHMKMLVSHIVNRVTRSTSTGGENALFFLLSLHAILLIRKLENYCSLLSFTTPAVTNKRAEYLEPFELEETYH